MLSFLQGIPKVTRLTLATIVAPIIGTALIAVPVAEFAVISALFDGGIYPPHIILTPIGLTAAWLWFLFIPGLTGTLLVLVPLYIALSIFSLRHRFRYYFLFGLLAAPVGLYLPLYVSRGASGLNDRVSEFQDWISHHSVNYFGILLFIVLTSFAFWLIATDKNER